MWISNITNTKYNITDIEVNICLEGGVFNYTEVKATVRIKDMN